MASTFTIRGYGPTQESAPMHFTGEELEVRSIADAFAEAHSDEFDSVLVLRDGGAEIVYVTNG